MDSLQSVKQRFGIIGNNIGLNRALEKALQVASTDISVLVIGESGVGKENIPKIIHQFSHRKHSKYIAVNCGAIPEGTIDSELLAMKKEPLLERLKLVLVILKLLMVGLSSSMKLENFRFQPKSDCSVYWKRVNLLKLDLLKCKKPMPVL